MPTNSWSQTYEQKTNSGNNTIVYTLTASESNLTNRTSDLTVSLTGQFKPGHTGFTGATGFYGFVLTYNGVTQIYSGKVGEGNTLSIGASAPVDLGSQTVTITHDDSGNANVNIKFYFYTTGYNETITSGATYEPQVPFPIAPDSILAASLILSHARIVILMVQMAMILR